MSKNTSILLGDHYRAFIAAQVQSGRYSSASEVVRAALRRMEEDDMENLASLRAALEEGEQSGSPIPFDGDKFRTAMKSKYVVKDV